jgi:non-ribosomal peptide synthase protein (TIGR01720 family)
LQASLDLEAGPLLRLAHFGMSGGEEMSGSEEMSGGEGSRLLLIIHHLAVDGVSWRILLEDLQRGYEELEGGGWAVELGAKSSSYQQWAERLEERAGSAEVEAEAEYWREMWGGGRGVELWVEKEGGANEERSARSVGVRLSGEETEQLLKEVPKAYNTQINEVLMTAMVKAIGEWGEEGQEEKQEKRGAERRAVVVEMEGHGREEVGGGIDVTRTVGWFTTRFPVLLDLPDASSIGDALKSIKEQLRRLPNRGIGYGLLRYLNRKPEISRKMRALPTPQISFNYLGQFDETLPETASLRLARESSGPTRDPHQLRSHLLDINGSIAGGQLHVVWTYSENLHYRATIERLAESFMDALRDIIKHCLSPEAGGLTPSDFPLVNLNQQQLEKIISKMNRANE